MEAARPIFWNIGSRAFLYMCGLAMLLSVLAAVLLRVLCWSRGPGSEAPLGRRSTPWELVRTLVTFEGIHLGHFPLRMHRCILLGFMLLVVATLLVGLQAHLGVEILRGAFYQGFGLVVDLAGLLLLAGLAMAAYKRYIKRAERLENHGEDAGVLALLALIAVSGFLLKGLRLAATQAPWSLWSPVGGLAARVWGGLLSPDQARRAHALVWHGHALLAMGFLALAPWTKLTHTLALPAFLRMRRPVAGRLAPGRAVGLGAGTLSELPLEAHVEADACMQCGRCRKQCPIQSEEGPASPESMLKAQRRLLQSGAWRRPLLGSVVREDALWSCTACRACEERCPMGGEHVERIVDIRRHAVSCGSVPAALAERFHSSAGPHREGPVGRVEVGAPGTLYLWPGCSAAGERGAGILRALLRLLEHAGVPVQVLAPPRCCSGTDRLLGNEALFQEALRANLDYLKPIQRERIVTPCPHCYSTLKGAYPGLGEGSVIHHTQLLAELQAEGLLPPSADGTACRVTYHDPCFLGRYHAEYGAGRKLLREADVTLVEMAQSRKKALCCGSGGGGVRTASSGVNADRRLRQAIGTGAELLVTSCPHCRESLRAASRGLHEGGMVVEDIAELLVRRCMA